MKILFTKINAVCMASLLGLSLLMGSAHAKELTVGGKGFTEQLLLAEMTTQLLEKHGYSIDERTGMGTKLLRQALENGQVDLYWEYTGTAFLTFHKNKFKNQTSEFIYNAVKEKDAEEGLVWLNKSDANNTYALAVRRQDSKSKNLQTLEDLADRVNSKGDLVFGSNVEFYKRDDGLKPLQKAYGFKFNRSDVKRMDSGLVYKALQDGQIDVGLVFATDGRIPAFDFVVLQDTKNFFPPYALTPVVRKEVLDKHTNLTQLLNSLSAMLNDSVMAKMNAQVDVDKKSVEEVATQFLQGKNLI